MPDFDRVLPIVERVCDTAVQALGRFCGLTDLEPETMPESFMAAFVFDQLGDELSLAPEIAVSRLWRWNEEARGRKPTPIPSEIEGAQRRIDLVIFDQATAKKSDQGLLALVEFKRNWKIFEDIEKVRTVLPLLDTCPFGATIGIVEPARYPNWLETEQKWIQQQGYQAVVSKPGVITQDGERHQYVAFGCVFGRVATPHHGTGPAPMPAS